jgi:hypothetical protein
LVPYLLGGLQNTEKEEGCSDIEKSEGSSSWKSQTLLEMEGAAIERIEKTTEDLRMAHKKGQDWLSMR